MNCPKCGSKKVVGMGGVMWCPDCDHVSDTSSVPPDDPALQPILIPCPMCSKQMSTHADHCPSCGQPLRARVLEKLAVQRNAKATSHFVNIVTLIILAIWIGHWISNMVNAKVDH